MTTAAQRLLLGPHHDAAPELASYFIFVEGEPVELQIAAETDATSLDGRTLAFEVRDFWGKTVDTGSVVVRQKDGKTSLVLKPRVPGIGWYGVSFRSPDQPLEIGYAAIHELGLDNGECVGFTIIPSPLPIERRAKEIGVDGAVAGVEPAKRELLTKAIYAVGVSWSRERFSWPAFQPPGGKFDPTHNDEILFNVPRHGVGVMNVFHHGPTWLRRDGTKGFPDDLLAVYRFGAEIAQRYGTKVFGWEIWNEQDIAHFSGGTPDHYVAIAKAAALGLRSVPDGGIASNGPFARRPNIYNEIMWANELMHYVDAYGFHGYAPFGRGVFYNLADVHLEEAQRLGFKDKEVWMSEMGAMLGTRNHRLDFAPAVHRQVHYMLRAYTEFLARGIDRIGWFLVRAWYGEVKGTAQAGLLRTDWTPFPSYTAMAVMGSTLGKAEYQGRLTLGKLQGYVFNPHLKGQKQVAVVWLDTDSNDERAPLDLRELRGVEVVDVMGQKISPSGGAVQVGRMPVYVKGVDWGDRVEKFVAGPQNVAEIDIPQDRVLEVVLLTVVDRSRIISRKDLPLENWDSVATNWAPAAYRFTPGETVALEMDVYNFSAKPVKATLRFEPLAGLEIDVPNATVEIAPMSKVTVPYAVKTAAQMKEFRLRAQAEVGGRLTTPYVALWQPGSAETR